MRLHNSILIPAATLLTLLASSSAAQPPRDHDPDAMDSTTTDAAAPAPPMTPEQIALLDRYLTTVHAQPVGKIDTGRAAAGQGITLQVTADATLANGTQLPRGTRLIGRILRAQAWEKDSSAAILSINVDQAVLHDGKTVPVRCVLRALASSAGPSVNMADASQRGPRSSIGPGPMGGGLSPVSAGPIGGGGIGSGPMSGGSIGADSSGMGGLGAGGSSSGAPGNGPVYGSPNPTGSTTRNGTSTTGGTNPGPVAIGDPGLGGSSTTVGDRTRNALGQTTAVAATNPEKPVARAGLDISDAPHRTGIPGVMLSGTSVAGVSGTLSAFEHNITLDSSTQLTLGVISR